MKEKVNELLNKYPENSKNWKNEDMRQFALFIGVNYKKIKNMPVEEIFNLFLTQQS